jgi:hypothetical protein
VSIYLLRAAAAAQAARRRSAGAGASPPVNTSPPEISGGAYAGGVLNVDNEGSWDYRDPGTSFDYEWFVGGISVGNNDPSYFVDLADEGLDIFVRVTAYGPGGSAYVDSAPVTIDLAVQIRSTLGGAEQLVLLSRLDDVDLVSGGVATWFDRSGHARNATQGTSTARPTYSAGLNGRPTLSFDGGDMLVTAAIDLSAFNALACIALFQDSITGNAHVVEFSVGADTTAGGFVLAANNGSANQLGFLHRGNVGNDLVRSAASYNMTTPGVVTGTGDMSLGAGAEVEIRHQGATVSNTRALTANNTTTYGTHALHIGARSGVSLALTGQISAIVIAAWSGGLTAGRLAQVAAVEALLRAAWGV